MRIRPTTIPLLCLAALLCCCADKTVAPAFDTALPAGIALLSDQAKGRMEGIYRVRAGNGWIGDNAVVRWSGGFLDIYCEKENATFVLCGGAVDTALAFSGRVYFNNSPNVSFCRLTVGAMEGMGTVLSGAADTLPVVLRGAGGDPSSMRNALVMERVRPLAQAPPFMIVAHKGGFLNGGAFADAENSIGVIRHAGMFGVRAIELDVRLTKDRVPVLFHDDNFTKERMKSEFLTGPVNSFTFAHIRAFGRLIDGQPLPSLAEILTFVVDSTDIGFVELDIKSPETVDQAIPVQREALERARRRGREVEILIDLGSEEIAEAYLRNPDRADAPCMCEVGLDYVRRTNARIWSPRWTLGPMSSEILQMHGEGRRVVPWTVDDPQYMDILLQTTETDGVLTDYPNMATYRYYVSH